MLGARSGNAHGALEATLGQTAVGFSSQLCRDSEPQKGQGNTSYFWFGVAIETCGWLWRYIILYFHVAIFPGKR